MVAAKRLAADNRGVTSTARAWTPNSMTAVRRLVSLAAVLAVLLPAVGPVLNAHIAAWTPNHGHAAMGAVASRHNHPYDHTDPAAHGLASPAAASTDGQPAVAFTFSDDAASGPLAIPLTGPADALLAVLGGPRLPNEAPAQTAPRDPARAVPTPPPRS